MKAVGVFYPIGSPLVFVRKEKKPKIRQNYHIYGMTKKIAIHLQSKKTEMSITA
ncbi:MAG: hypothetical protein ISN28_15575 [Ectothiorhodospiraceae bacterium AqS1]|nr:hypothetical protein [Ectothiorhodospiraceae bacterium AqS1]MBF2761652.1 hypothetical protein [Ectothiorhodospiraceae bacterium AqS1]